MKRGEFLKLKEYEWDDEINSMKVGENFLMGDQMIAQKEELKDYVSYYVVKSFNSINNSINIEVKMEKLED